jgi:hypothetical protein
MTGWRSWAVLAAIYLLLVGACGAMAGGLPQWPGSLSYAVAMVAAKLLNDRLHLLKWPMEFVFWSAILFVALNLTLLHFQPL